MRPHELTGHEATAAAAAARYAVQHPEKPVGSRPSRNKKIGGSILFMRAARDEIIVVFATM